MAGPIIHLLAARAWAVGRPDLAGAPEFYLGAIAPDAIHARSGAGKADKQRTHLGNHSKLNLAPMAAYARTRATPFDLGYLAHLLTDSFWCAAYHKIPGILREDGHTNAPLYYREMNRCESALLDAGLLAPLRRAAPPADHPLLTAAEIAAWRDRVLLGPRDGAGEVGENGCLTLSFVTGFIARTGDYIDEMMRRLSI